MKHAFKSKQSFLKYKKVILLTGSNMSNPLRQIENGRLKIARLSSNRKVGSSKVLLSSPWGKENQADFYNQVLLLRTFLPPLFLLSCLQKIERSAGRNRIEKWGARTLDVDMLYYHNQILEAPSLVVPHPYLHERRFTLVLLHSILPTFKHPVFDLTHTQLLFHCNDTGACSFC
jgi:2-amino-4-hydroxy-6-hydroxymethyldihydropteridine diphosphokinase